jgi:hypothetical protein
MSATEFETLSPKAKQQQEELLMMTRDEAYSIICDLNEEAHAATWDEWEAAGDDEDMLADASFAQSVEFREAFQSLDEESQQAVLHYEKTDADFAEEFNQWWGAE